MVRVKFFNAKDIRRRFLKAFDDTVHDIVGEAVRLVAVRTGFLKVNVSNNPHKINEDTWAIIIRVKYARHIEFGTRFMKAQPYLRPAIKKGKKVFLPKRLKQQGFV